MTLTYRLCHSAPGYCTTATASLFRKFILGCSSAIRSTKPMASKSASKPNDFVKVFSADDVPINGNRCVMVSGRGIVIWRRYPSKEKPPTEFCYKNSAFYALDATCYHM